MPEKEKVVGILGGMEPESPLPHQSPDRGNRRKPRAGHGGNGQKPEGRRSDSAGSQAG